MRLFRALALSPALLIACDEAAEPARDPRADDLDAFVDASLGSLEGPDHLAVRAHQQAASPLATDRGAALPVIAPPRAARANAALAAADRAAVLRLVDPILAAVPGLVDSLATGALGRATDGLALAPGVAELTGAPWLLVDGRLVLAQGVDVEREWASGVPRMVSQPVADGDDRYVARRDLAEARLPSALRALVGATVKVYDREREVCVARVSGLALEARLVHGADQWDDATQRMTRVAHDATAVFELGLPMLVGALEPVIGAGADCQKGLWAAPVTAATPRLYRAVEMDAALAKAAVRAFRKLPAWQARQHDFATFYADEPPAKGRWDGNAKHTFQRWLSDDGKRELLAVSADTWDGCGSSGQRLTALFEVGRADDKATFTALAAREWADPMDGVVDLEGDGALELIAGSTLYRWHDARPAGSEQNGWRDERYEEVERVEITDLTEVGCGC